MDQITIVGRTFTVPNRYAEGHPLTAGEASALNQTLHENIRNNMASKIKKSFAEGQTELPEDQVPQWQTEVDNYANTYVFGVRVGGGRGPAVDPETRLAIEEATAAVKTALGDKAPKGKELRERALKVLEGPKGDQFRKIARDRVRATRRAAEGLLDQVA